jgi:dienelactone hydrolase
MRWLCFPLVALSFMLSDAQVTEQATTATTAPATRSVAKVKPDDIRRMTTPDGVEFGVWGKKSNTPASTLVVLSGTMVDTFTKGSFLKAGEILGPRGYLCVSIDLPNHGSQVKEGYSGVTGWAKRASEGDDFVADFNHRMSKVLDYLVAKGMTDPAKIAVTGTSRGGFLAMHYLAFDPRVKCAVAYAPATDLTKVKYFDFAKDAPMVKQLGVGQLVPKLAGKPLLLFVGDRDTGVDTESVIRLARDLSTAAMKADVPSLVELHVVSEPRGHALPTTINLPAAMWIYRTLEGSELFNPSLQ